MVKQTFTRLILVLACLMLGMPSAVSQEKLKFRIVDFGEDQFDFSAKDPKYEKRDGNNERFAIIKVRSNNPNDDLNAFNFNFGNMKHMVVEHAGELWVYVQRNAKMVTITRDGYAPLLRHDLHTTIEGGKNYVMTLSSDDKKVLTQMVQFNVKPANSIAAVMVKNSAPDAKEVYLGNVDESGSIARNLEYGTYTYRVMADNYHTCEGKFTLNNKIKTFIEDVTLRPNFSQMTFVVNSNADIYINGVKKGTGKWTGILKAGQYQVECRQANHKPTSQYVTVEENDNRRITLTAPEPIMGMVAVTSTPLGASIMIDGKDYGVTPKNLDIVTGLHTVELSMNGYTPSKETIEVNETGVTSLDKQLSRSTLVTIDSNPSDALLSIDGKEVGRTPIEYQCKIGNHQVELFANGYRNIRKNAYFGNQSVMNFDLQRKGLPKSDYYASLGIGVGTNFMATLSLGAHWKGFNSELYYSYGLVSVEADGWGDIINCHANAILGGKIGYGFNIGDRFKITPQIGYKFTYLANIEYPLVCQCLTLGARVYYGISKHFGISLTPEFAFSVNESDDYSNRLVEDWNYGTGFIVNLGFVVTF